MGPAAVEGVAVRGILDFGFWISDCCVAEFARIRSWWPLLAAILFCCAGVASADEPKPAVIVVVGAEGETEFRDKFRAWAARWEAAAKASAAELTTIGLADSGGKSDRDLLVERLAEAGKTQSTEAVWLVLIGHGTFDGKTARFNLRGADFTPAELAGWLKAIERPLAVLNCASASGPFVTELSGKNRVVVSATKSGHEYNFARFGDYLSAAIGDLAADLDKDAQTSLLEAYLMAAGGVNEFYKSEARLATEHALLDDNGDKLGTPADFFQGVRAVKSAKSGAAPDGLLASQLVLVKSAQEEKLPALVRARRDELERQLGELRLKKSKLPEEEYFALLEPLLLELSKLYESADKPPAP
jgi:hypothetical protein